MRSFLRLVFVLMSSVATGCGADETMMSNEVEQELELELASDIRINRREDVVRGVQSIVVVIDSPEGIYAPGSEGIEGDFEIKDDDGDASDLELVAVVPVEDGRLESIRLRLGNLHGESLFLSVFGVPHPFGAGAPVAVGGAELRVTNEGPTRVSVPFNLLPRMLPPRVMDTSIVRGIDCALAEEPEDCAEIVDLILTLSKRIDQPAAYAEDWLEGVEPVNAPSVSSQLVRIRIDNEFPTDAYALQVLPELKDLDGIRLDQLPEEEGEQPFRLAFEVDRVDRATSPLCGVLGIDSMLGERCPGPDGRFECVDHFTCVPASCSSVSCPAGYVCDPARALCDVDCRVYGSSVSCPAHRPACDAVTGACVAEPQPSGQ